MEAVTGSVALKRSLDVMHYVCDYWDVPLACPTPPLVRLPAPLAPHVAHPLKQSVQVVCEAVHRVCVHADRVVLNGSLIHALKTPPSPSCQLNQRFVVRWGLHEDLLQQPEAALDIFGATGFVPVQPNSKVFLAVHVGRCEVRGMLEQGDDGCFHVVIAGFVGAAFPRHVQAEQVRAVHTRSQLACCVIDTACMIGIDTDGLCV